MTTAISVLADNGRLSHTSPADGEDLSKVISYQEFLRRANSPVINSEQRQTIDNNREKTNSTAIAILANSANSQDRQNTEETALKPGEEVRLNGIRVPEPLLFTNFHELRDKALNTIYIQAGKREDEVNPGRLRKFYDATALKVYKLLNRVPREKKPHNEIVKYIQKHCEKSVMLDESVLMEPGYSAGKAFSRMFDSTIENKPHLAVQVLFGVPMQAVYWLRAKLGFDSANAFARMSHLSSGSEIMAKQTLGDLGFFDRMYEFIQDNKHREGSSQWWYDMWSILNRTPLSLAHDWYSAQLVLQSYSDPEERAKMAKFLSTRFINKISILIGSFVGPFAFKASIIDIFGARSVEGLAELLLKYAAGNVVGGAIGLGAGPVISTAELATRKDLSVESLFHKINKDEGLPIKSLADALLEFERSGPQNGSEQKPEIDTKGKRTAKAKQRDLSGRLIDAQPNTDDQTTKVYDLKQEAARRRAERQAQVEQQQTAAAA